MRRNVFVALLVRAYRIRLDVVVGIDRLSAVATGPRILSRRRGTHLCCRVLFRMNISRSRSDVTRDVQSRALRGVRSNGVRGS